MLDAILQPEWDLRYFSFNANWKNGEMMASMRDGSGDDVFTLFIPEGAIIKGYAHESLFAATVVDSRKPWPGILDDVPTVFGTFLSEPAFSIQEATFCIWRREHDVSWNRGRIVFPDGEDPDGSADLLFYLDGFPNTYRQWAEEFFERSISLELVEHIYQHGPLTPQLIARLNSDITIKDLAQDIREIGYPLPSSRTRQ
jgi:hypothetical protein